MRMSENRAVKSLYEFGHEELYSALGRLLSDIGAAGYRRKQIIRWLYERTPERFSNMSDLPKSIRAALQEQFVLHPLTSRKVLTSVDGTRKFLWLRSTGGEIESVLIPDGRRTTYCISTQVGCPVKCTFCATGYGGFSGQLSPGEIVDQVLQMRRLTDMAPTNLVLMGMGEPLLNFNAVVEALRILTHAEQAGLGARRVTISTVGIPDRIRELARTFPQIKLALSLHAPNTELRNKLIPLNRQYPLGDVLDAVSEHVASTRRRATFEYVILPGVNDAKHHASAVARLLESIPSRVNLIGFNPFRGAPYRKPSVNRLLQFRSWLERGYSGAVTIRRSRGEDIQGACGQLSLENRYAPSSAKSPS